MTKPEPSPETPSARRYHRRKAAGLCTICGKRPPREGFTTCAECARYSAKADKVRRHLAAQSGICTNCCARPALPDRKLCEVCTRKRAEQNRRRSKAEMSAYRLARYARLKAAGLCTTCGKRKPPSGRATCAQCLAKRRSYDAARKTRKEPA